MASFQSSFAVVIALVLTYEFFAAWRCAPNHVGGGWAGWPLLFLGALLLTSNVANLTTLPFSAYHFNRFASHGLVANMRTVPLAGFWSCHEVFLS